MAKLLRAHFECIGDDTSDVHIDLVIGESRRVNAFVPLYGYWGKLPSNDVWPFIYKDGRIDFGNRDGDEFRSSERFADFHISERIIAVGEVYELFYYDETRRMKLKSLTDLLDRVTG